VSVAKGLKEKIQAIFKLKGITVTAVISAVRLFFTTLGLSISNALSPKSIPKPPGPSPPGPSPPGPSPPEPSLPDKVKEGLKKFAEWLKELAKKSAGALPGIIGSIDGTAIGFLAQHLIILGIIIVSCICYGLVGVKTINKS
jgi:hypothetical protein